MSTEQTVKVFFRSVTFNTSEAKEYFINDCCYGDDVCRWLRDRLRAQGLKVADEPGQEDFGWYLGVGKEQQDHMIVVAYQEDDSPEGGRWWGLVERNAGCLASLLGRRSMGIAPEVLQAIQAALSTAPEIHDIRWHTLRNENDDTAARPTPTV